jgi:hypothetical protein
VEKARVGEQFGVMGEPDEYGFVEERVRLQAEVEPLEDGDQPEQDEDRKKRKQEENRYWLGPTPFQGYFPALALPMSSAFN